MNGCRHLVPHFLSRQNNEVPIKIFGNHMLLSRFCEHHSGFMKEFESPEAMIKDIGKNVRSMPQIKINDELVGGYNQLIEHYNKLGLVDFKGNKISE